MAEPTYAFIDLVSLPAIRDKVLTPEAAIVFREHGMSAIWGNAAAAELFGLSTAAELAGDPAWAGPAFQRQVRDAALQIDDEPVVRGFRISRGARHDFIQCTVARLTLPGGEAGVLLTCSDERHVRRRREHELAQGVLAALGEGAAAIVDDFGLPIAYSDAFVDIDIAPETIEGLVARSRGSASVRVENAVDETGAIHRARLVQLREAPGRHLLLLDDPEADGEAAPKFDATVAATPDAQTASIAAMALASAAGLAAAGPAGDLAAGSDEADLAQADNDEDAQPQEAQPADDREGSDAAQDHEASTDAAAEHEAQYHPAQAFADPAVAAGDGEIAQPWSPAPEMPGMTGADKEEPAADTIRPEQAGREEAPEAPTAPEADLADEWTAIADADEPQVEQFTDTGDAAAQADTDRAPVPSEAQEPAAAAGDAAGEGPEVAQLWSSASDIAETTGEPEQHPAAASIWPEPARREEAAEAPIAPEADLAGEWTAIADADENEPLVEEFAEAGETASAEANAEPEIEQARYPFEAHEPSAAARDSGEARGDEPVSGMETPFAAEQRAEPLPVPPVVASGRPAGSIRSLLERWYLLRNEDGVARAGPATASAAAATISAHGSLDPVDSIAGEAGNPWPDEDPASADMAGSAFAATAGEEPATADEPATAGDEADVWSSLDEEAPNEAIAGEGEILDSPTEDAGVESAPFESWTDEPQAVAAASGEGASDSAQAEPVDAAPVAPPQALCGVEDDEARDAIERGTYRPAWDREDEPAREDDFPPETGEQAAAAPLGEDEFAGDDAPRAGLASEPEWAQGEPAAEEPGEAVAAETPADDAEFAAATEGEPEDVRATDAPVDKEDRTSTGGEAGGSALSAGLAAGAATLTAAAGAVAGWLRGEETAHGQRGDSGPDDFETQPPENFEEARSAAGDEVVGTDGEAAPAPDESSPEAETVETHAGPEDRRQDGFVFHSRPDPVRFAWTVDQDRVFLSVSPELALTVGPNAADVVGRRWIDVAKVFGFDRNGDIERLLEKRDTWSGKTVLWPVQGSDLAVPVDLAALPAFSGARAFDGFRGFGIIRTADAVIDPDETGLALVSGPFESRDRDAAAERAVPAEHEVSAPLEDEVERRRRAALENAPDEASQGGSFVPLPANVVDLSSRKRDRGEELSSREAKAFREIGRKLGVGETEAGSAPAPVATDEPGLPLAEAPEPAPAPGETPAADAFQAPDEPARDGADAAETADDPGAETTILAQLPVPVIVYRTGETLYANPELLSITGYGTLEALAAAGGVDALFTTDGLAEGENDSLQLRRADGSTLAVSPLLQRAPWRGGRALLLTFRPPLPVGRTEEKAAIDSARVSELKSILDTATDGIVITGADGLIESVNGPGQALFGLTQEEAAGRPLADLFAPESHRALAEYLREVAEPGLAGLLNDGREVIGREAKGGLIPLFVTVGRAGEAGKYCAVLRDITHWKKAEEELVTARRAAETASEQKSEFLARVSHEIRTPLNAIIGFSDVMIEERFGPIENERYRGYLRDINRSGVHVLDLINDLLDISKIEAGKMELTYEAVDLNQLVQETVALLQPQANAERIIIRTSLSRAVPRVVADARSIRQIILNLVSNAIKFTPANGQVIVSTVYEGNGEVVLRVRDTGRGMSEREIEHAMKPFHQINVTDERRGHGTGLGLPLTKALVEANRAYFDLESTPGEGTIAHVHFPTQRVLAD